MNVIWSESIDAVLNVGVPLHDIGISNWALSREEALNAISQLAQNKVAVLGGDVYVVSLNSFEHNYDNWFCDKQNEESEFEFLERSIGQARSYIKNYNDQMENVRFSLVPKT